MRKIATFKDADVAAESEYPVPVEVRGAVSAKLMSPADYEIWLCVAELEPGTSLVWPQVHSEQVVYVLEGSLEVCGRSCEAGGAVVVEADVPAEVQAASRARIAHYGSRDSAPPDCPVNGVPDGDGHGIHVVGPKGLCRFGHRSTIAGRWVADGRCPTCRVVLFEVARDTPRQGNPHNHSASEIIYVVEGSVHLGSVGLPAGSSLCIPGGVRYAEASGPDGATFLNFRPMGSVRTNFFKDRPAETVAEDQSGFEGFEIVDDVVTLAIV